MVEVMMQSIISILVASCTILLGVSQVAAEQPGPRDLLQECQDGSEPCNELEPGYTDVYFEDSSCAFACDNPQGFTIILGEEPALDKDALVIYHVKCRVGAIMIDEVSLVRDGCPVGDIDCGDTCGRIVGLPLEGVEQVPEGTIPVSVASICRATLWVWVDGDDRVAGEPVFAPCAAT